MVPPAQPRPNTGTRAASGRNPIRSMARASRLGVAMPVEDTVTMASTSAAVSPASSSAAWAAWTNRSTATVR